MLSLFYRIKDYFSKYERHMRKINKFYEKPRSEETYALDLSIIEFILPRLQLFWEKSNRIIDWDFDEDHRKVRDYLPVIISDFQFYLKIYDYTDVNLWLEARERVKHGLTLLIEIFPMLSW